MLLANDTSAAYKALSSPPHNRVVTIILDNCGLELLADLSMADALLCGGAATHVHLCAKDNPVFVSDVVIVFTTH